MSRGGPPREVGEVLERARQNAGRRDVPTRSSATEAPLERFERLAAAFHQETGLLAPGKDAPAAAGGFPTEREREDRWTAWLAERRRAAAAPAPEEREPAPNGPEDVGFTNSQTCAFPQADAPAAPRHDPKLCSSCNAPILWAQILELDERGRWNRVRNDSTGRFKSMPVDFQPNPDGNLVLFHRDGEGVVCRVLKKGWTPPPGARLRTSHFASCPAAANHRRKRGRR